MKDKKEDVKDEAEELEAKKAEEPKAEKEAAEAELTEDNSEQEDKKQADPAPVYLASEKVLEVLEASSLPVAAKRRMAERLWRDEEHLEKAVTAEIAYLKEITKSGEPFGMDSLAETKKEQQTPEQYDANMNKHFARAGIDLGGA